jgi:hypothetical protein
MKIIHNARKYWVFWTLSIVRYSKIAREHVSEIGPVSVFKDRLCGLVVRVPGYRSRGSGFDSRRYQIF